MGFPSMCSCILVPKPLVALVLLLDRITLFFSTPLLYFGLYSPDDIPSLTHSFASPLSDTDHAYRLSAADLPSSPLPTPCPSSVKRRLRLVRFGKLAAASSSAACGSREEGEEEPEHVCAVCLCGLGVSDEVRELGNCRHAFHRGCIDRWVDQGRLTCPLCRARLLPRRRDAAETIASFGEELLRRRHS